MTDLTPLFVQCADRHAKTWTIGDAMALLQRIRELVADSVVDWEQGDEHWGRILLGDRVLSIVCVLFPLVISTQDKVSDIGEAVANVNGVLLPVTSMAERSYSACKILLETLFHRPLTDAIDYHRLSIDELWWATV
jgi:hypothetical protein